MGLIPRVILHMVLIPRVIPLKLFLDMVLSSSADVNPYGL